MKKIHFVLVLLIIGSLINIRALCAQNSQTQDMAFELRAHAHEYEKKGNLEKALELYQKAFETSKDMPFKKTTLLLIGQVYRRMKKYEEALQIYQKYLALASNPFEIVKGKRKIAYIYVDQKKYPKGLKILDKIIEEYPKEKYPKPFRPFAADAQFSKAAIYHNFIKDYEKAISEYQKMIKEYPDDWRVKENPICLYKIAACYSTLKKYDDAIEISQKIINDYPGTDFSKAAELGIEFINEYARKGIEPPPGLIKKKREEAGLK